MRSHTTYLGPLWLCVQVVVGYVGQYQLVRVIFSVLRGLQRMRRINDPVVSNVLSVEAEITDFSFIMSKTNNALSKKFTQRQRKKH